MKILCIALIMFCGLLAGNADAANWVRLVDSKTSSIFVDTDSINRIGDIVAAWYRRDFNQPMTIEKKHRYYKYKSSKVLNYFNCTEHEMAAAQWITYEKTGGLGKIISNEKVISLAYGDVLPGETGEVLFNFVCKHAKPYEK